MAFPPDCRCSVSAAMAGKGHEEAFSGPRLSARYRFSQGTFAGTHGNGRDAPTMDEPSQKASGPELALTGGAGRRQPFPLSKTNQLRCGDAGPSQSGPKA